jgi:adenylate cyclase
MPRLETLLVAGLTLALAGVYLFGRDSGVLQAVEGVALTQRFLLRGPQEPGHDVAIVAIDEASLASLGRWPVSRQVLAEAVDRIAASGAATIVFDLMLVGPETEEADTALATSIVRAGNVVIPYAFTFAGEKRRAPLPNAIERSGYHVVRTTPGPERIPQARNVLVPLLAFIDGGTPGHVSVLLDNDGQLRFIHPAVRIGDGIYPSLAVAAARRQLGLPPDAVGLDLGGSLRLGEQQFETTPDLALAINYAGPAGSFPTWSLADLLLDKVPPAALTGRVVVIGATASGLGDRFVTPYDANLPGAEVFANAIDNLIRGRVLARGQWVEALDLLALLLAGIATAALSVLRRNGAVLAGGGVLLLAWCVVNVAAFSAGLWLNFTLPALAIVVGTGIVVTGRGLREGALSRRLARYVSPLGAGGPDRDVMATVMFVDLVGFTGLGETQSPAEIAGTLRGFHARVERAVAAHGGVVDNFIGDAVLAVFGLPGDGDRTAGQALAAARAVVASFAAWNVERRAAGLPAIECGIGVHFGPVRIAEVGGTSHARVTVTGDTVNVASRLEGLTRDLHTAVVVSDAVIRAAGAADDFAALPPQPIRGRAQPMTVWTWRAPA